MIPKGNDIANELQEIIPGAQWPEQTPFGVPAGYFEQLPEAILSKIRAVEVDEEVKSEVDEELGSISPLLSGIARVSPFTAPQGYFEELPGRVLQEIYKNVNDSIALSGSNKDLPFTAPAAGYFDSLPAAIMQRVREEEQSAEVKEEQEAIVIPMPRRRNNYFKWAAAACLIALVGTGTSFFLRSNHPIHTDDKSAVNYDLAANLSDVSDQEIVDYLQTHMDAFDKEDLLSYTAQETTTPLPTSTELSAEAIERYLDNTGSLKEMSN